MLKKLIAFFYQHPIFTLAEFNSFLSQQGQTHKPSHRALLAYHKRQGHIIGIRRGLFAVVPPLAEPNNVRVDPYLIAGRITDDAVIAYHSALELHGLAYSVYYRFYFTSQQQIKSFTFQNQQFKIVPELICNDLALNERIKQHPALKWAALQHRK